MNGIQVFFIIAFVFCFVASYTLIDKAWNMHIHECFYRYYSKTNDFVLKDRALYMSYAFNKDEIYKNGLVIHDMMFIFFIAFAIAVYWDE